MAEDKRTAPGNKPRRRHAPQIELTATEIGMEPASAPESEPQAQTAEAAPEPSKESLVPPSAPDPSPAMTYAAIAGAVIAAVIVGGGILWMAGKPQSNPGAELSNRIAALETQIRDQVRDLAQRPAPQGDTRALDALTQRIAKLEEAAARPAPAAAPDGALAARITAIESNLAALNRSTEALQSSIQQTPSAGAIDALAKRLDTLEQSAKSTQDKIAQNTGTDAAARGTLATLMLRDAVSRGAPFGGELAAVKTLGGDAQAIAALEPFAASGIPNEAALSRDLSALLPSMIAASNADPVRSGGFLEKLEANASRLVRIRPVGEPRGDDPAAVLARIEVKLARNDVAGADSEIAALPEKARALTGPWRQRLAARNAALGASRKLASEATAALAR